MVNRIFLISLLIFLRTSAAQADTPPSNDIIQAWWEATSAEKMTIEGNPVEIRLRDKEVAYLIPVGFYERGRNFIWHTAMVRPALREIREVEEPVRRDIEVHDLNSDGISEIVTVSLGSGQGSTIGVRSIVQFDGWTPIVLHKAGFEDNAGARDEQDYRFFSRSVSWEFVDLNSDGVSDLNEEITIQQGRNGRPPVTTKIKHKFIFKENAFVKYVDYKTSHR